MYLQHVKKFTHRGVHKLCCGSKNGYLFALAPSLGTVVVRFQISVSNHRYHTLAACPSTYVCRFYTKCRT